MSSSYIYRGKHQCKQTFQVNTSSQSNRKRNRRNNFRYSASTMSRESPKFSSHQSLKKDSIPSQWLKSKRDLSSREHPRRTGCWVRGGVRKRWFEWDQENLAREKCIPGEQELHFVRILTLYMRSSRVTWSKTIKMKNVWWRNCNLHRPLIGRSP